MRIITGCLLLIGVVACTNRVPVGQNKTVCDADEQCPESEPRCETEVGLCSQCLDGSDCGGEDPRCDEGVCVCASDEDCAESLSCVDERCSAD